MLRSLVGSEMCIRVMYTYGPILGLFVYGMFWKKPVHDRLVPVVCVAAPCLSWALQLALHHFFGYETSFELLIFNAIITVAGLRLLSLGKKPVTQAKV